MSRPSPRAHGGYLWLLCASLTCLACRPQLAPGMSAFNRADSTHFTIYGPAPQETLVAHARTLETLLRFITDYGFQLPHALPMRMNVVMLAKLSQVQALHDNRHVAGYAMPSVLFEPWIVMALPRADEGFEIATHELTHAIAAQVMPHQPRWFAEGLAEYFETASITNGRFVLGNAQLPQLIHLLSVGLTPVEQLFDVETDALQGTYYGTAWLLVHYLMSKQPDAFVAYQQALARGMRHQEAWALAFPGYSEDALNDVLAGYAKRATFDLFEFDAPARDEPVQSGALRRADEEALWALLWSQSPDDDADEEASEHLARALALDPWQPLAQAVRALQLRDARAALDSARRAAQAAPALWLPWLTLAAVEAHFEETSDTRPSAADRALALVPRQPFAVMYKALELHRAGDHDEALRRSEEAVRLQPGNPGLLWHRAELLAALGACAPLMDVQRRFRQLGHDMPKQVRIVLEKQRRTCHQNAAKNAP